METIRDAYMVVAGVPNKTTFHAHHICDMALDMLSSIDHLKDPSTGDNIQIRVGEDTRGRSRGVRAAPRRSLSPRARRDPAWKRAKVGSLLFQESTREWWWPAWWA